MAKMPVQGSPKRPRKSQPIPPSVRPPPVDGGDGHVLEFSEQSSWTMVMFTVYGLTSARARIRPVVVRRTGGRAHPRRLSSRLGQPRVTGDLGDRRPVPGEAQEFPGLDHVDLERSVQRDLPDLTDGD